VVNSDTPQLRHTPTQTHPNSDTPHLWLLVYYTSATYLALSFLPFVLSFWLLAFVFCLWFFYFFVFCNCFCFVNLSYPKVTTPPYPLHFTNVLSQYPWKNEISVLQRPISIPLATQTHLLLQDTRILTWWWPPEAETCRLIIKIPYISCNKLFSNLCLVFNLNYYKFVVLDVHTLLFSILEGRLEHWRAKRLKFFPPSAQFHSRVRVWDFMLSQWWPWK